MLMAMGAVMAERWVKSMSQLSRRAMEFAFFLALAVGGVYIMRSRFANCISGRIAGFRAQKQWRSARGNWLGRSGESGGGSPGFIAARSSGKMSASL